MKIDDNFYMKLAIDEAWKYQLLTYPNPAVGCVIVKNGRLLSIEAHKESGQAHAEVNALKAAYLVDYPNSPLKTKSKSSDIHEFFLENHNDYFNDCSEDLSLDLEAKNVEFGYFNYVEPEVKVIADPEQIKRVVHNIVNNSVKYMDKDKPKINLRVKDVGDFVQVEIEDNGKGIASKDLPNVFERFYRTDASRNSSKGGSGIGLSIVKKIIQSVNGLQKFRRICQKG